MLKLFVFIGSLFALLNLLSTSTLAHSTVQVIKMTPGAFEPATVEVDENSTIIFINQDTVGRWPASNLHPTHDLYPEFDPKKTIQTGESWSFKPKKAGEWKYHDHESPHIRGTLKVTAEKEKGVETIVDKENTLTSIKNWLSTLFSRIKIFLTAKPEISLKSEEFKKTTPDEQFKTLASFAKSQSGSKAWEFVQKTYLGEGGSSGNIHDLSHLAGKLIYEDLGIGGISSCTATFSFGCYHGLLDAAFKNSLEDLSRAESECKKLGAVGSGPYGSCVHGIGHGVASFYQTENIKDALASCGKLPAGQDFCYDGVFMEFVRGAPPTFYSKENPLSPCDSLEKEFGDLYSLSCGRNQPSVLVSRLGNEFSDVVSLCEKSTLSDKFKSSCFDALGFMLAGTADSGKIISGCKTITNTNHQSLCFKSAAGELIFQNVPGWQGKSKQVCDAAPAQYQAFCHENLQRLINEYGRKASSEEDGYVRAQMKACYDSGGKDNCYKKVAEDLSDKFGLKKTLAVFAANEDQPEIFARCHEATHYLSRNEYRKTGSVPQVYSQCDSTCHGGCYHGVLEQYIKDKGLAYEALFSEFPKVCGKSEDFASPLVFNECHHGLGHAAMFVTDMDVPGSLALCDALQDLNLQERCWSGVFMENSSSSTNNDHPGRYVKAEDPLFPCNTLDQKYAKLCYRYQSSHFALITNHNWSETAKLCLKVPNDYQNDCVRTIGTNQVGFTQDTNVMRNNCSLMPNSHFQEVCYTGVISSFAYRYVGDMGKMESFCASIEKSFQEACIKQIGSSVVDWSKDNNEAFSWCDKITNPKFISWCKNAVS